MRDEIRWLALGIALGNQQFLARLTAEVPANAFDTRTQKALFAAIGEGRDAVIVCLSGLGVPVAAEQRAADAVLEVVREFGERAVQESAAWKLGEAARMMRPEQFREYLVAQTAALTPAAKEQPKTPQLKIAAGE